MKTLILTLFMTAAVLAIDVNASDYSFEGRTTFQSVYLQGRITVQCGNVFNSYICSKDYLKEGNFSKFITKDSIDADKVELNNITNSRVKKVKYSSSKKSTKDINLWVDTLLQRSFLDQDGNMIEVKFFKNGNEVQSGKFSVDVLSGEVRNCPRSHIRLNPRSNDCNNINSLCEQYFQRFNNCH